MAARLLIFINIMAVKLMVSKATTDLGLGDGNEAIRNVTKFAFLTNFQLLILSKCCLDCYKPLVISEVL